MSRGHVLDVKLRSSQVRAARTRLAALVIGVSFGIVFGLYVIWRAGEWTLDRLIYENRSFAIQETDIQTDGVISVEQLRRWSGIKPGENLLALDLARVKRDLELVPLIQTVSVERVLPRTLRVRVTEREPVAQINVPRPREGGGLELIVFLLDAGGSVMLPLDPRQRAVPVHQAGEQLPLISGLNASELQPGRRVQSPQVSAALQLIDKFDHSPMAGFVDLKRVDVASAEVLVVTTGQGSEITFSVHDLDRQLRRWREIHEAGLRMNKTVATLDLAVANNIPATWAEGAAPPPPRSSKPSRTHKKNV
jgi:cell division septal protein FtsQ